jgi:hypothetical protein
VVDGFGRINGKLMQQAFRFDNQTVCRYSHIWLARIFIDSLCP